MSGPEQDDDKGFLARWSQRKQEAKQPETKPVPPDAAPDAVAQDLAGDGIGLSKAARADEVLVMAPSPAEPAGPALRARGLPRE